MSAPAHAGPALGDPHGSPARRLVRRWWFSLAMGMSIAVVLAFLTLPVVAIFVNVSPGRLLSSLGGSQSLQALRLSLETSAIAVAAVVLVGTPGAYLLATRRFRGDALVLTLIELPLVLPPAVAGIGLLASLGPHGLLGGALAAAHIQLVLQTAGVVVALAFVSAPLYLRQAHAAFAAIEREHIEGALALGIRRPAVFLHVAVPIARPALLAGLALAWGRALGEFGATLMFAGSFQGITQTIPLAIYDEFSSDFPAALALSALLVVVSAAVLLTIKLLWTPSRPPI
ncbi:MAG TPA: molybdate ABC transporter permease subunit [Solirubrobacteraceae bacterium]|nr:molybdate ABC transporter permease subunit [Solirubrobacteraceae bacterium]